MIRSSIIKVILIVITFGLMPNLYNTQTFSQQDVNLLSDLLQQNDQDLHSLNFLKDWSSDTKFKLPLVVNIINNPMQFPVLVDSLDNLISRQKLAAILPQLTAFMNWEIDTENYEINEKIIKKIKTPKQLISWLETEWILVDEYRKLAFVELSLQEKSQLYHFCLSVNQESEDEEVYKEFFEREKITTYDDLSVEIYQEIIAKIDFNNLMKAAYTFEKTIERAQQLLPNISIKRFYEKDTRFGKMTVGTPGQDVYTGRYAFIYDPAGNDVYQCQLSTDFDNPYFLLIDAAGDDVYRNYEIHGMASVIAGLGAFIDLEGNDIYQSGDLSFSSMVGYFSFQDFQGDDYYSSGLHTIGAASLGISLFYDYNGNDRYNVTELGEGFAGTLGLGILADFSGNDIYFAGGKYLHAPLAPLDYRSLSQGFSIGGRPDLGGGIGVLYDKEGNDVFQGGVYAQGVGYWYALGILIDKGGNDFYDAVYYPQGSGIHLAGGFLYDEAGEDNYYSKHGPGQGAGHDYGVGFLVDRGGDDRYSVEGGNGLALTNSVGIFLDVSGNDNYQKKYDRSYGFADVRRGSGGLGLFLDTGGDDNYSNERCANDTTWTSGTYGYGLDKNLVNPVDTVVKMAKFAVTEVDSLAEISEIFALASEWGVGSAVKKVESAGKILLKRDAEAAKYIFENQLGTKSGLKYRAIKNYALKSIEFSKYIPGGLAHTDSLIVKNCIAIVGELADTTFFEQIVSFLYNKKYVSASLSCMGSFKTDETVDVLAKYVTSENEKWRIITARSLKKIDSEKSRNLLLSMSDDNSFLIRTMIDLLVSPQASN